MLPSEDGLIEYVVQVEHELLVPANDEDAGVAVDAWVDVATVRAKPRTHRKTIIESGLRIAGIEKTPELCARVLGPQAAYVWRALPPAPAALRLA